MTTDAAPPPAALSAGPAVRAALRGDLAGAADLADAVLGATDGPGGAPAEERARAARVLAEVLAHAGMLTRAAELHLWARSVAPATPPAAAAVALVGTATPDPALRGPALDVADRAPDDRDEADERGEPAGTAASDPTGRAVPAAPTLGAGAEALVARGVRASVEPGRSATALADLIRAAAVLECGRTPAITDDSPAALGALVAIHRGEVDLARAVLDRALATELAGPAYRRRHLLLRAWADLAGGDLPAARTGLAAAAERPEPREPRDELVALGLEAALARLLGDPRASLSLWARARPVVLGHAVDLWSLLPLAELRVTAAQVRDTAWMAPRVAEGDALLDALGRPPLWIAGWDWKGFLAAVLTDDVEDARGHTRRLRVAAQGDVVGDSLVPLLVRAADQWLEVLDGVVDPAAASATAHALRAAGHGYEAARLAREAAGRTDDRRVLSTMLGVARAVLPADDPAEAVPPPAEEAVVDDAAPIPTPADGSAGETAAAHAVRVTTARRAALSHREREVAVLLLQGMTYRQIAEQLFISVKTVEHHVGRIRQRLGSGTRNELFADLRETLGAAS